MLYSGEATLVSAPAANGEIGFMYQCSPLMSTIKQGEIRITPPKEGADTVRYAVSGGYVEADGHKVVVLATRAMDVNEVDRAATQERIAQVEQELNSAKEDDPRRAFLTEELEWQKHLEALTAK
jgi:F-type H+-transporting ATPase subunit epsilon